VVIFYLDRTFKRRRTMGEKKSRGVMIGRAIITAAIFYVVLAVLFSPLSAGILMAALTIHEMGHIWAMHRCGVQLKSLYFIPLVGALAVPEKDFGSRREEAFMAIMGPAWGFGSALVVYGLHLIFGLPEIALVAKWIAILNAFNLIPVSPLDGGRVVKSIIASVSPKAGAVFLALGPWIMIVAALHTGFWLLMLIAFFAYQEYRRFLHEHYVLEEAKVVLEGLKGGIQDMLEVMDGSPEASGRFEDLFYERVNDGRFSRMATAAELTVEAHTDSRTAILRLPFTATRDIVIYKPKLFLEYLKKAVTGERKPEMTGRQVGFYTIYYLVLGVAIAAILVLGHVSAGNLTFMDMMGL
jgi:Zn-dependent protease